MSDYDNIKKKAEQFFGKNTVERFEQEIRNRANDSVKIDRIIDIEKVNFNPKEIDKAKNDLEKDERASEKVLEFVEAKNKSELARIRSKPKPDNDRSASERLLAEAIKGEYRYGMLGLILGIATIIGGIVLCLNGVAGATSWTASLLGLESRINDAAPGVVLFITGIFFVWITKPKVKIRDLQG
jgi:hypothetical protein